MDPDYVPPDEQHIPPSPAHLASVLGRASRRQATDDDEDVHPSRGLKRTLSTREGLLSKTCVQLKQMCRERGLMVTGRKDQLIDRILNPDAPNPKRRRRTGPRRGSKRAETIYKRLTALGVKYVKRSSRCFLRGCQRSYVDIFTDEGLDKVIFRGPCEMCGTENVVRARDVVKQDDYPGCSYYSGPISCPNESCEHNEKNCGSGVFLTGMCSGEMSLTCGKYHNHCRKCPGFGQCIGGYRQAHCGRCGKHYFKGLSGFRCQCRSAGAMFRRGGGGRFRRRILFRPGGIGGGGDCSIQ